MMERRELFRILTTGAVSLELVAQHRHEAAKGQTAALQEAAPLFFTQEQQKVVDALCDIILPTDELSPGAHAAQVWRYLDLVLFYGPQPARAQFQDGMRRMNEAAREKFGRDLQALQRAEQESIVGIAAERESRPGDVLGRFFASFKAMTIAGFHCSEVGMKEYMHYEGNTAAREFVGCNHAEHQKFDV